MAHTVTAGVSLLLAVLIFATMQAFRTTFAQSQAATIFGGFAGSNIFLFLLTAVSNVEMEVFGGNFQAKLFPEVLLCLGTAMFASGLIHRVCVTTCFLFSLLLLYCVDKISTARYTHPAPVAAVASKKKK